MVCNFDRYPYEVNTYARQMIIRESNVTERSLVTRCRLLNASRSDDNPNGFTIEGFTILETETCKHWRDKPMRKLIERLGKWTDNQDERLRAWLEALPQRTKLAAVLVIFALCALFTFGTALYEIGRESGRQIEIEHIRQLDLRQRQDSINLFKYYNYDRERTEQESYGLSQRGEA